MSLTYFLKKIIFPLCVLSTVVFFLGYMFGHPSLSFAQSPLPGMPAGLSGQSGGTQNIEGISLTQREIRLEPENPRPNETVEATLVSYSVDLSSSQIVWFLNDENIAEGTGRTSISFKAGSAGSTQKIKAVIIPINGAPLSISRLIRPTLLTIAWEAQTYTPPLYRGKALQSAGATVKFVGVPYLMYPDGTIANPQTLVYEWRINDAVLAKYSGVGRQVLFVKNTTFVGPLNISLSVHSADNKLFAEAKTVAKVTGTQIHLYELHPRYGTWYAQALGDAFRIQGGELNVIAEPYYFSAFNRTDENLIYTWSVGNNEVQAREVLTLRPVGEGGGLTRLSLSLRHAKEIVQMANRIMSVTFEAGAPTQSSDASITF